MSERPPQDAPGRARPPGSRELVVDLGRGRALIIPDAELSERFSHASGPGGQGINTADSRVELLWDIAASPALSDVQRACLLDRLASRTAGGVLRVTASEYRAQRRNRTAARQRLITLVADALSPPAAPRRPTRPSRGARQRRLDDKRHRGEAKRARERPRAD